MSQAGAVRPMTVQAAGQRRGEITANANAVQDWLAEVDAAQPSRITVTAVDHNPFGGNERQPGTMGMHPQPNQPAMMRYAQALRGG